MSKTKTIKTLFIAAFICSAFIASAEYVTPTEGASATKSQKKTTVSAKKNASKNAKKSAPTKDYAAEIIKEADADAETKFTLSIDEGIYSKYIWRGIVLNDDPVFQGSLTLGYGNWSLNIWHNTDTSNENGESGDTSEIDYTLSYATKIKEDISLELGLIYYDFPHATGLTSTREIYASVTWDKVFLTPTLSVYYDIGRGNGFYVNASVSHSVKLTETLNLDIAAGIGAASQEMFEEYYGPENQTDFTDANIAFSVPFKFKKITITPSIQYTTLLGEADLAGSSSDNVMTSLAFGYEF